MFTTKDAHLSSSSSASQVLYTRLRIPTSTAPKRFFFVKASGFTLLHNFNASTIADVYGEGTLYKEFCLNIDDQEQSMNITFTPTRAANPEGSVKMSVSSPVWLKSSSKAAMATTTCFLSVIILDCNKQVRYGFL
ncbi:hypothetical protein COP2_046964 [Malus domestica]